VEKNTNFLFEIERERIHNLGLLFGWKNDAIIFLLEPFHGILLVKTMRGADAARLGTALIDVEALSTEHNKEIQTIDTDGWIVLDAQINVLLNAKAKIASVGEVVATQFVFLHLKTLLENLLRLGTTDRTVDGNLLITTNAERSDSVACLRVDGRLSRQLFQHLGCTGESVTGFAHTNVETQLSDSYLAHRILSLILGWNGSGGIAGGRSGLCLNHFCVKENWRKCRKIT